MAARKATAQRASSPSTQEFAINKTRGLAFSRRDEAGDWQAIDLKSVGELKTMERVSHAKIGENWFSIYRAS